MTLCGAILAVACGGADSLGPGPGASAALTPSGSARQLLVPTKPHVLLTYIGAQDSVGARLEADGRIADAIAPRITWSAPPSSVVRLDSTGVIEAIGPGVVDIVGEAGGLTATVRVEVRPVPATLRLAAAPEVMRPGDRHVLAIEVADSAGVPITEPDVRFTVSDTLSIAVSGGDTLQARLPGPATIVVQAGPLTERLSTTVRGVGVLVDGAVRTEPGPIAPGAQVIVGNAVTRLFRRDLPEQRAGVSMQSLISGTWREITSTPYGDYTYVGSSVQTGPTAAELVVLDEREVSVRWRFGGHQVAFDWLPAPFAYPFTKTIWLRADDRGYFARVVPETTPPVESSYEHELGFGGLWGPAVIRFGRAPALDVADLTETQYIHRERSTVDAADFRLAADGLVRTLVPLPGNEMIVPAFPGVRGSVYIHQQRSQPYGAYLHVTDPANRVAARTLCRAAWAQAPFPLPTPSTGDLEACGTAD